MLRNKKIPLMILCAMFVTACAINPKTISLDEKQKILRVDRTNAQKDIPQVGESLSLYEAVARGLKYNLDYRSKMMEQAIAMGTYELSNYDMLPKVLANAGYNSRNNDFITKGVGAYSGTPATSEPFVSSARNYTTSGLALNWNLLDFGVSYFNAKQNADRVLVAGEKRRRSMHVLIQDIQTAYLRAAAAQQLKVKLLKTIDDANIALKNSEQVEAQGLRSPIDALRYQKTLLENVKVLETINQELSTAQLELNQLINLPANASYKLDDPDSIELPNPYAKLDTQEFEIRALMFNADLNESVYNARIANEETRKALLRLVPGLTFNIGTQHTNNAYWINKNWVEGSANVSFNLWSLLTAPQAIELADNSKELAQQKRMMVQMAVISQVYLAKMSLESNYQLYQRSSNIDQVDGKIAKMTADKEKEGAVSQAERVAADASAVVSKLRKYQALSQLFSASGKMQASVGLEPRIGSLQEISLTDLTEVVRLNFESWNSGNLPPLPIEVKEEQVVNIDVTKDSSEAK